MVAIIEWADDRSSDRQSYLVIFYFSITRGQWVCIACLYYTKHFLSILYGYKRWYSVNYDNVSELLWGRNAGCDFAQGSCFQYLEEGSTQSPPFCNGSSLGCTVDGLFVGSCGISQYNESDLPADYQVQQFLIWHPSLENDSVFQWLTRRRCRNHWLLPILQGTVNYTTVALSNALSILVEFYYYCFKFS